MIIDISHQATFDSTLQLLPVKINTGSALSLDIFGVPKYLAGKPVLSVTVTITNPDAVTASAAADKLGSFWSVKFAASLFTSYGEVLRGLKISATTADATTILALADFVVVAATPDAAAGSPGAHYQSKGGDIYIKSEVIDDIQHYKRLSIAYSSRLGTWGFNDPEGDYVLSANGDFVPAT